MNSEKVEEEQCVGHRGRNPEAHGMSMTAEIENTTSYAAILGPLPCSDQRPIFPESRRRIRLAVAGLVMAFVVSAPAQKLSVTIINRQDNDTDYTYVVPGYFNSYSNSNVNCNTGYNCNGSNTTSGSNIPAQQVSYHVRGATFALQLPDGRTAVVNCESKFKERMAGPRGNRRSCHIPLVDNIQAEFHSDNAKLAWVVSLDGKKKESETYKILAVLEAPTLEHPAEKQNKQTGATVPNQSPEVMTWFDEPNPGPTTEIRDVTITVRAYDGVLNMLSKLRDSDTTVKSGVSVLEVGYHPPSFNLGAGLTKNQSVTVFQWDDEALMDTSPVMHIKVTLRVYDNVSNAVGHLRVTTFIKQ
jgi:hypothetical protein